MFCESAACRDPQRVSAIGVDAHAEARHAARSVKPTRAIATSAAPRTALVHSGSYKAAPSNPTTLGGGGEIRTHEGLTPLPVFKTGAFNRSATPPGPYFACCAEQVA